MMFDVYRKHLIKKSRTRFECSIHIDCIRILQQGEVALCREYDNFVLVTSGR